MSELIIRAVDLIDLPALYAVATQTFIDTYAEHNTAENVNEYLAANLSAARLMQEISNPNSKFYFGVWNGEIAGYLKLNFGVAQTELHNLHAVEIERIYISKGFQGKQVGRSLYNKAVIVARQANATYLWLGVWEHNTNAIEFYKKMGLVEFNKHTFIFGSEAQTDIMMRMIL